MTTSEVYSDCLFHLSPTSSLVPESLRKASTQLAACNSYAGRFCCYFSHLITVSCDLKNLFIHNMATVSYLSCVNIIHHDSTHCLKVYCSNSNWCSSETVFVCLQYIILLPETDCNWSSVHGAKLMLQVLRQKQSQFLTTTLWLLCDSVDGFY